MAIGYIKRLAGPYIGDGTGQKTFSFGFFVFTEGDVYVATAATENGASSNLQQGTDYTVTLNGDQEASPGGTITLTAEAGLADGAVLVIGSDVDYTQTLDLTNYTRFPPARISEELDRIVVQIQQLVEILGRTVKVDATDTMTPEELKQQLLEVAASAGTYRDEALAAAEAAAASESAAQTAQAAAELAQGKAEEAYQDTQDAAEQAIEDIGTAKTSAISEIQQTEQTSKTAVTNEGTNQIGLVQAEGTKQIGLVGNKGTEQITAVGSAGSAQIQAVGAKGTEQIGLVQTEGTTQVNAVKQAGTTQVKAVQDEGATQVQAVTTVGNEKITAATEQAEAAAAFASAAEQARDDARGYANDASQGQIQADWAQTDSTQKDFIKNRPATFPPSSHTHEIAQVNGLQTALDSKQPEGNYSTVGHKHTKSEITDFAHTHGTADITGFDTALAGKANVTHTHAIIDITGLQAALDATVKTTGDQTIEGTKTFMAKIVASAGVQGKADSASTSDDAQSILAAFQEFATENNIV